MSILIIGGNGYIGSRIFMDLRCKFNVQSVDSCWYGKNLRYGTTEDYRNLSKEYLTSFSTIILLSGHSSVKMCQGEESASHENNVNNFIHLVGKLNKDQVLIYASSGSVYGNTSVMSSEDMPLGTPMNHYDRSKHALDRQAEKFIRLGYTIVGLRFGTVNGWSLNTREELMITSMTKKAIETGTIFVSNKNIVRPILGIADIPRAIEAIMTKPVAGIYNLASFYDSVDGISSKVREIVPSTISIQPDVPGPYDFIMDTTKFRRTFSFDFRETIQTIVEEIRTRFNQTTFSNRNQFKKYE